MTNESLWKESFGNIAEDLVTLEINTILKPNMTARKMPTARHAIIDIAQSYADHISVYDESFLSRDWECHSSTFHVIRQQAKTLSEDLVQERQSVGITDEQEQELMLLIRIMRNSDQMIGLLDGIDKRMSSKSEQGPFDCSSDSEHKYFTRSTINAEHPPRLNLTPDERVLLRKIWEVGTETVAMQSTVQIDGDVIGRLRPGLPEDSYLRLQSLHQESIKISITMWQTMIQTVFEFIKAIGSAIVGGTRS
ncbi:MAG: hypothetical protein AAF495_09800 [Pseudomonadota bacterium]